MLSRTAVVLDKAADLDQKCLDAVKSVSLNETGCVMISRAELLQSRQSLMSQAHKTTMVFFVHLQTWYICIDHKVPKGIDCPLTDTEGRNSCLLYHAKAHQMLCPVPELVCHDCVQQFG